jgi:prepilin peptidase CpaA
VSLIEPTVAYSAAAFIISTIGAVFDIRTRRIPNWITGPAILTGLVLHGWLEGWRSMGTAGLAGLIAGATFFVFHIAGGVGGGDVKLIAAVGCTAGLSRLAGILIATALVGGAFAMVVALYHRRLKNTLSNLAVLAAHHGSQGLQPHSELNVSNAQNIRLPYGIAIAAGTAIVCWNALMS